MTEIRVAAKKVAKNMKTLGCVAVSHNRCWVTRVVQTDRRLPQGFAGTAQEAEALPSRTRPKPLNFLF